MPKKVAVEYESETIRPKWGRAERQPDGIVAVTIYSPPKNVWAVCEKYLLDPFKAPGAKSSWRTDVTFAFHAFMSKEYVGPGDDAEMSRAFRRIVDAVCELKTALKTLPTNDRINPTCLMDAGIGIDEVLDEVIEDYEYSLSTVDVKHARGAPTRKHVKQLAALLSDVYRMQKKPRKPLSPARFLVDVELAFLQSEGVAIGFPKRITRDFSVGARVMRRRAK